MALSIPVQGGGGGQGGGGEGGGGVGGAVPFCMLPTSATGTTLSAAV